LGRSTTAKKKKKKAISPHYTVLDRIVSDGAIRNDVEWSACIVIRSNMCMSPFAWSDQEKHETKKLTLYNIR
jgi:hypothetical protein